LSRRDRLVVLAVALVARLAVVVWAAGRIPPAADGTYYHVLAQRIAEGHGYTWLWPDGAVTYAAHYPVGYPAIVAAAYALFGARPVFAMLVNAALGVASAVAIHDVLDRATSRRLALAGGLAVALHPALVPFTAALMTEGVTASLLAIAVALADRARISDGIARRGWILGAGLVLGLATLVRPQSLVLAPIVGWLTVRPGSRLGVRAAYAAAVTALALAVCAPWTARNCARMERCALVSVNGGWNLAIGTQTTDGNWAPIVVTESCKTVFEEAA
jgi:4-amino-4-deoxy-L-arabinose transferase-like glycosyltransferase